MKIAATSNKSTLSLTVTNARAGHEHIICANKTPKKAQKCKFELGRITPTSSTFTVNFSGEVPGVKGKGKKKKKIGFAVRADTANQKAKKSVVVKKKGTGKPKKVPKKKWSKLVSANADSWVTISE